MSETKKTFNVPLTKSKDPELEGVADIGEGFKVMLPGLQKQAEKAQTFFDETRAKVAELEPEYCLDHPSQKLLVNWEKTFGHTWKNQKLEVFYHTQCQKCEDERGNTLVNERWLRMGIPQKVVHATFDNFKTDGDMTEDRKKALAKIKRQVRQGGGFALMVGKVGTGKTHLGAAAIKACGWGEFVTLYDLIAKLRQSYDDGGQEELVEKYRAAKCFVLDEISKEVKGSDIAPLLYRILSTRYDKGLLTILTSNEDQETIKDIVGIRIADRMRESLVVANFTWASARRPNETNPS